MAPRRRHERENQNINLADSGHVANELDVLKPPTPCLGSTNGFFVGMLGPHGQGGERGLVLSARQRGGEEPWAAGAWDTVFYTTFASKE